MKIPYYKDEEHNVYVPALTLALPMSYIVLTDDISNICAKYHSILEDLRISRQTFEILSSIVIEPNVNDIVKKALYNSAVLSYARCYSDSKDGRKLSLNKEVVFTDERLLELHKQVMDVRNDYIAHAGDNDLESSLMVLYYHPDPAQPLNIQTNFSRHQQDFPHDLTAYFEVIERTAVFVREKLDKLMPKFMENIRTMDLSELRKKSKLFDPDKLV